MSMSIIGLILLAIFTEERDEKINFRFNKSIFQSKSYSSFWPFTGFIFYFFWIFISFIWSSDNVNDWFEDVVGKLSLIGIPFMFIFLPKLVYREIKLIHFFFYAVLVISCLLITVIYIPQFDNITLRIGSGRPIPTPIDHVRFSMMVSYASLSSFAIALMELKKGNKYIHTTLLLIIAFIFFGFSHALAVRSGLILLYSGIAIMLFYFIISFKAYILGLLGIVVLITIPLTAFYTVPSFKNKILYTKYDIQKSISNDGGNYSDGDRIRSIKNGLELWKQNIVLGLGAGNYKQEMKNFYLRNNQVGRQLLPHNQWIRTGMAYGLVGVLLLLSAFIIALFKNNGYRNILLILILQLLFFSLLVESNLERYYALVFFFIFIGINAQLKRISDS